MTTRVKMAPLGAGKFDIDREYEGSAYGVYEPVVDTLEKQVRTARYPTTTQEVFLDFYGKRPNGHVRLSFKEAFGQAGCDSYIDTSKTRYTFTGETRFHARTKNAAIRERLRGKGRLNADTADNTSVTLTHPKFTSFADWLLFVAQVLGELREALRVEGRDLRGLVAEGRELLETVPGRGVKQVFQGGHAFPHPSSGRMSYGGGSAAYFEVPSEYERSHQPDTPGLERERSSSQWTDFLDWIRGHATNSTSDKAELRGKSPS